MKQMSIVSVALALLAVSTAASAIGDSEAGRQKAQRCVACHGQAGVSMNPQWPNLAGQKDKYLIKQLQAFRSGSRSDPLMSLMAKPLSDADIEDLAAYFSGL